MKIKLYFLLVGKWKDIPANNTIYVNNINEKLKRDKLIQSLQHVFGQFGKILNIICYTKILKAKGQAFIIFDYIESAKKAVQEMQSFQFYNKPIRVSFAKTKSNLIAKRQGIYKLKDSSIKNIKLKKYKQISKKDISFSNIVNGPLPSNILKISNLPLQSNLNMVQLLFKKYPGFYSVSNLKDDSYLITFNSVSDAARAKQGMNGYNIGLNKKLIISFYSENSQFFEKHKI